MTGRPITAPTIPPLLKFFVGLELTVELKNGRKFHGILDAADDFMNLVLTRAVRDNINLPYPSKNATRSLTPGEYNMLHIRGASIRYVLFPDRTDLPKLIKAGLDRERSASERYARGKRSN
jgi:small nuclear ribonucleoprotein (snRNP)-like protein